MEYGGNDFLQAHESGLAFYNIIKRLVVHAFYGNINFILLL